MACAGVCVGIAFGTAAGLVSGQSPEGPAASAAAELLPLPSETLPDYLCRQPIPIGFSQAIPAPTHAESADLVQLGRRLFFEPRLSADETVSCATCHRPDHGFAAPQRVAVGISSRAGRRNSPSLLNRAYGAVQFWDGRAKSLEEQALEPIGNPDELGSSVTAVVARLAEDSAYEAAFAAAFPGEANSLENADGVSAVTPERLARALAAFQRTLIAGNSPADQFRNGAYGALTDSQRQGMWLFESRGRCWICHSGDHLSDEQFHNTGVGYENLARDEGRFVVTQDPVDRFRFKTPGLRGVALTAPYFHDGSAPTLEDVVRFYNRGGAPQDKDLDERIKPLNLSDAEVAALADFLRALTPEPENPR